MNATTRKTPTEPKTSKRPKRERARSFDPCKYPADREFMREFTREAEADTTGNPVYKAIAQYDRKRYKDLLD